MAALGAGVSGLEIGQRVGVSAISGCGQCANCRKGKFTWCREFQFNGNMHAQRFAAPAIACHILPDDLSWDTGVLISGDGFGVPYHTSTKTSNEFIQSVAIFGLGPIGQGNTLMQSHLGRDVIGIDIVSHRLELAKNLGATHVIHVDDNVDVAQSVRDLTGGRGTDICIEAAGLPQTAKQCFGAVCTGGTVIFNGEQPAVELSPSADFIRREITAVGAWYYLFSEFPAMLKLVRDGLEVDKLVTHSFSMEEAAEGYRLMADGLTGKVLLTYGEPLR